MCHTACVREKASVLSRVLVGRAIEEVTIVWDLKHEGPCGRWHREKDLSRDGSTLGAWGNKMWTIQRPERCHSHIQGWHGERSSGGLGTTLSSPACPGLVLLFGMRFSICAQTCAAKKSSVSVRKWYLSHAHCFLFLGNCYRFVRIRNVKIDTGCRGHTLLLT